MFLGKRAVLRHFNRAGVKFSDRRDVSWFGLRQIALLGAVAVTAAALASCAQSPVRTSSRSYQAAPSRQAWLPTAEKRHRGVFARTESVPRGASVGETWTPTVERRHHTDPILTGSLPHGAAVGVASFYTEGVRTASGERLNPNALTAAHPSLPFGTRLRITSVASGRSVVVRVNDRGPFIKGRAVDVSYSAAKELGMTERGVAKVKMEVVQER
jgi:rare lipoprotein A